MKVPPNIYYCVCYCQYVIIRGGYQTDNFLGIKWYFERTCLIFGTQHNFNTFSTIPSNSVDNASFFILTY